MATWALKKPKPCPEFTGLSPLSRSSQATHLQLELQNLWGGFQPELLWGQRGEQEDRLLEEGGERARSEEELTGNHIIQKRNSISCTAVFFHIFHYGIFQFLQGIFRTKSYMDGWRVKLIHNYFFRLLISPQCNSLLDMGSQVKDFSLKIIFWGGAVSIFTASSIVGVSLFSFFFFELFPYKTRRKTKKI